MLDGVFYSGNGRACGLTTAGGVDDPQQLSAGGASAASPASRVEGQSHRGRVTQAAAAAASQTLHSPTLPPLPSPLPPSPPLSRLTFYHRRRRRSLSQSLAAGCFSSEAARHEESAG